MLALIFTVALIVAVEFGVASAVIGSVGFAEGDSRLGGEVGSGVNAVGAIVTILLTVAVSTTVEAAVEETDRVSATVTVAVAVGLSTIVAGTVASCVDDSVAAIVGITVTRNTSSVVWLFSIPVGAGVTDFSVDPKRPAFFPRL